MKSFYLVTTKLFVDYSKANGNLGEPCSVYNDISKIETTLENAYDKLLLVSIDNAKENGFEFSLVPKLTTVMEAINEARCIDVQSEWKEDAKGVQTCVYYTISKVYGN